MKEFTYATSISHYWEATLRGRVIENAFAQTGETGSYAFDRVQQGRNGGMEAIFRIWCNNPALLRTALP